LQLAFERSRCASTTPNCGHQIDLVAAVGDGVAVVNLQQSHSFIPNGHNNRFISSIECSVHRQKAARAIRIALRSATSATRSCTNIGRRRANDKIVDRRRLRSE
jgi:hypothetical protein